MSNWQDRETRAELTGEIEHLKARLAAAEAELATLPPAPERKRETAQERRDRKQRREAAEAQAWG